MPARVLNQAPWKSGKHGGTGLEPDSPLLGIGYHAGRRTGTAVVQPQSGNGGEKAHLACYLDHMNDDEKNPTPFKSATNVPVDPKTP